MSAQHVMLDSTLLKLTQPLVLNALLDQHQA